MKKIIYLIIAGCVVYTFFQLKSFDFLPSIISSNDTRTRETTIDLGRLIEGNKLSVRDQMIVEITDTFHFDGCYWFLGDEHKAISRSFFMEYGYFPKDIIKSTKIEIVEDGKVIDRILQVSLPLPDTVSFMNKTDNEESFEWPWQGVLKCKDNLKAKQVFKQNLQDKAYYAFQNRYLKKNRTKVMKESAKTLLNYVNNAYRIGGEPVFSSIEATFIIFNYVTPSYFEVICDDQDCKLKDS